MKTMATTALTLALALPALADTHTADDGMTSSMDMVGMQGELIRTRDITGGDVYTTNEADDEGWDADGYYDALGADWNEIGEIEEVLINASGEVVAVTVEAGGFLDIGDEEIVFTMDMLSFEGGQYVTDMAATDIEGLPRYDD